MTRDCHAGILREPGGEIPPGHPTRSILRPRPSVTEKFEFIDAEYAAYQESEQEHVPSIVKMCIWMEVSRSGFYEWRNAPESATAKRRGILALYVQKSFEDSDDTYGYRRVHADLVAWGVPAGPELVRSAHARAGPGAQWPCLKGYRGIVTVSWHMMVLRGCLRTAGCRTGSRSGC